MTCTLLFKDQHQVKTPSWVALDYGGTTCINYIGNHIIIPIPFAVFDKYTDHCSKLGITANLLPDNLPNIVGEFGRPMKAPAGSASETTSVPT
jgi:hypothetical protein